MCTHNSCRRQFIALKLRISAEEADRKKLLNAKTEPEVVHRYYDGFGFSIAKRKNRKLKPYRKFKFIFYIRTDYLLAFCGQDFFISVSKVCFVRIA